MATRSTAIYGDQLDDTIVGLGMVKDTADDFTHKLKVDIDGSSLVFNGNTIEVGTIGAGQITVDNVTIEFASGDVLQVKDLGITNAKIADDTIAEVKLDIFNAPSIGLVLGYTANGLEWIDPDVTAVQETDLVFHEVPTGLVDSSNVTYTIANTPLAGSVQVFLNGLLQRPGSAYDYTISGTTITFAKAPRTNTDLLVHYVITP